MVEVLDGGRPRTVSLDDLLAFHGGGSPAGVTHAFRVLERALPLLSPDGPPERDELSVRTACDDPGARDGVECATGAVGDGRYVVDPELARPELGLRRQDLVFEVGYRGRTVTVAVGGDDAGEEVYEVDPRGPSPLAEAVGGPLGVAETSIPAVAFVVAYTISDQDTDTAALVAVAVAVVLAAARLARRETPRHALSGLVGVAFAAFIATRSGKAENFFLPGLLLNAAYATGFLVSLAVRRPLVGIIVGQLDGEGQGWRKDPRRMRAFTQATWVWAGLFLARLVVQLPLYLAGDVVALGVARTAMGVPLFVLGFWLTYRLVRRPAPAPAT